MLRGLAAALLAVVLSGVGAPVGAQQSGTVLRGTVRSAEGEPVGGVTVLARGATVERAAVTGLRGEYRLGPLPAGRYVVRAQALGYRDAERTVELDGSAQPLDLVLEAEPIALAPLEVLAVTRAGASAATLPIKVEVIGEREVQLQQSLASNPTELLSNLIPSFSPGRQKLTSAGESFRGRRPLFLIDGVPQSNPLRDGRRDGFTIDLEAVERVEVLFGANAVQGLGATGGIVNYVTVSPPSTGELEQRVSFSTTSSDGLDGDGFGWRGSYLAGKRFGELDALGSVAYERRGLQFDALGRPIAIDNVQGDVADSHSLNWFGKLGWEPTPEQRVQLTINRFRLEQAGNFESVAGDRALGLPAVSVSGAPEGVEPINDVTTLSLDYRSTALWGATMSAKAYYQDFAALYGGGRFGVFQDPAVAPVGELFDQSENNSEKLGARFTYTRPRLADAPLDLAAGLDLLRDRTFQRLVQTDRNWVPATAFENAAPFAQLDAQPLQWLSLTGGVRWELARLDVPDFTTLAGNRADFATVRVRGGSPAFDEPLFNVGGVLTPREGLRFYGTLSQAFTMPDVGRVLRGVSQPGTAVDDFLDLQPIKTDNLELGGAWGTASALLGVTWFRSDSDMGSRLVPNADGIFEVHREPTRTEGWELNGRLAPHRRLALSAGYATLEGRYDGNDDGTLESDLGAGDIGPDRLNLSADLNPGGTLSGRLQSFTFFDRAFRDGAGEPTAEFDGYTTVDASVAAQLGRSRLILSASNLLDEQYITYFGQAATNRDDRFFAGRGRTLSVRVERRF